MKEASSYELHVLEKKTKIIIICIFSLYQS